ncbi:MAG: hypothetical protein ACNA7H_12610, partial [Desulfotignum sp.]
SIHGQTQGDQQDIRCSQSVLLILGFKNGNSIAWKDGLQILSGDFGGRFPAAWFCRAAGKMHRDETF